MTPERIIPASYWVTERLAAGQYPGAKDPDEAAAKVARFAEEGVTTFIDLTHPADMMLPYEHLLDGATRVAFPIIDNDIPTEAEMSEILDAIDSALDRGDSVYVHCWGGHGRTGTVIGCWLVRHGATYDEAVAQIDTSRRPLPVYRANPLSPQTPEQHAFVRAWIPGR
jgi:hypothetical protein